MGDKVFTQEELDNIIKERLARQEESIRKEYADYDVVKKQVDDLSKELESTKSELIKSQSGNMEFEKTLEALNSKIKVQELSALRTKVAIEYGVPYALVDRITGDDEEGIRKDAQSLAEMFKPSNVPPPPLKSSEPQISDEDKAYKSLLKSISKGE